MEVLNGEDKSIEVKGIKLKVKKGVFNPDKKITNSTSLVLNNLPVLKDKDVLDVGCGTGIIAIACALSGAKRVVAIDVDKNSLENAKINVKANNVQDKVEVIESDLFDKVHGKFDYILANLPISDKHWNLSVSTLDLVKKFVIESLNHTKENGKIYIVWASFSKVSPLKQFFKEKSYNYKEIKQRKLKRMWYLFEISL